MPVTKVVRYRTKPECADENERLIRDVFAELADVTNPMGLHYASFRLDDGVSFLHVAVIEGEVNPLQTSKAFARVPVGHRATSRGGTDPQPTPPSSVPIGW
jgi:hypothetical protein